MRANEFTSPKLMEDINGNTNYLDLVYLVEASSQGQTVDENDVTYLDGLLSDQPIVGNKYSVGFVLCLPNSRISLHGIKTPTKLTKVFKESSGLTVYQFENGKRFPDERLSTISFAKAYLFENGKGLNEFLSALSLKFTTSTDLKEAQLDELNIDNDTGWGQTPNNANVDYKGLKVKMAPPMFLRLAAELPVDAEAQGKIAAMVAHHKTGGKFGAPTLYIDIPRSWEDGDFSTKEWPRVRGHEGRHRMNAEQMLAGEPTETHIFISGFRTKNWAKNDQSDYTPEIVDRLQNGPVENEDGLVVMAKNKFLPY